MFTKAKSQPSGTGAARDAAKRVVVKGKRMVLLDESEFDRLLRKADEFEPLMPALDANGTYPALEALRITLARGILRHRRRLGLTQTELARRAGIRAETLNRIEQGHVDPSVRTIQKIDAALHKAEAAEQSNGNAKAGKRK